MSIRAFAGHLGVNERTVTKWEAGDSRLRLRPDTQAMLDTALARTTAEVQARFAATFQAAATGRASAIEDDEFEALELARRVAASDVGTTTLTALEEAFDGLAIAYQGTQPAILLSDVRRYLSYVGQLVDKRATLNQRRRLLVVGGWLSLLAATLDIDLHRRQAGNAQLATAASMADDAGHNELAAWCLETKAWDALTGQQFKLAAELSQAAQKVAPQDGSAFIQATAQEGRAWARLGEEWETRDALGRVERLVS